MLTLSFLVTSLIVVLIPGITLGRRASIFASLGCTAGFIPHLLATVLGLSAVMLTSAVAFQGLKHAGVAYLLYLAYATWRDKTSFAIALTPNMATARRLVTKAFLLNILIQSPRASLAAPHLRSRVRCTRTKPHVLRALRSEWKRMTTISADSKRTAPRRCRSRVIKATSNTMAVGSGMQRTGPARP